MFIIILFNRLVCLVLFIYNMVIQEQVSEVSRTVYTKSIYVLME